MNVGSRQPYHKHDDLNAKHVPIHRNIHGDILIHICVICIGFDRFGGFPNGFDNLNWILIKEITDFDGFRCIMMDGRIQRVTNKQDAYKNKIYVKWHVYL